MPGKVPWHVTMSLDGFIAGPDDAMDCLDEIVVHLAPVLLGDGIRFHGGPGVGRVNLERTAVAESGQLTDLRFSVLNS